jgi:HYDIN/CFA65/VesB family protein
LSTDRAVTFEDQVLMTFLSSAIDNGNDRQRVLGDYMQMKTVGRVFYGAFTANGIQFGRPFANHDPIFFRTAIGPLIAVKAPLDFGDVCIGETELRQIEVFNTGTSDLIVSSVAPIAGSDPTFRVDPNPVRPVVIQPGSHVDFAVYCEPTTIGNHTATIRITSNDPDSPQFDVQATCTTPPGDIAVTGSTDFGQVCTAGAEKTIAICNVGLCDLNVTSVSFDPPCPDFTIINNPFPAVVSHDACVDLTIRFTPTSVGPKSCTLRIVSDDPDEPVIVLQVTADVPLASIDVPTDLGFPPTVTQDVGACHTLLEFPISNTGECPLVITNVAISGTNAGDFFLVGLPSFPIILEPGHIVGEGDFRVGFAPTVVARHREATLTVTFETDPVTGATDDVARRLCGEGVRTGARVLVTNGAPSYPVVKSLKIQRINANRNRTRLDTVESLKDVALVTVAADPPCDGFQYHREYGTQTNPIQLLPGSYQVTAMVLDGGRHLMKTVGFDVHTCDFNPRVVIDFGAPAMVAGDGSTQPGPSDENVPETTSLTGVHTDAQARAGSVSFDIAVGMAVRLEIFDVRGRLVRILLSDDLEVGKYRVNWNGRDQAGGIVPRGVYLVRLVAGDMRETRKLVLAH